MGTGRDIRRSSQEDEGVPELKQREALSDQSNFAEDLGSAPAVVKRHYAVRRKTSFQLQSEIVSVLSCAYISYVYIVPSVVG